MKMVLLIPFRKLNIWWEENRESRSCTIGWRPRGTFGTKGDGGREPSPLLSYPISSSLSIQTQGKSSKNDPNLSPTPSIYQFRISHRPTTTTTTTTKFLMVVVVVLSLLTLPLFSHMGEWVLDSVVDVGGKKNFSNLIDLFSNLIFKLHIFNINLAKSS